MRNITWLGLSVAALVAMACGSDDTSTSGAGASASSSSSSSTAGGSSSGGNGSGGSSAGGSSSGGSSSGGAGGASGNCGDMGLDCMVGEVCVHHVDANNNPPTTTYTCEGDPCAPNALDCSCAQSLCGMTVPPPQCMVTNGEVICTEIGVCASPDTPIATPTGERPIAELHEGDLVYSMDGGRLRAVPLIATSRRRVHGHAVSEVVLDNGRVLHISGPHPTADGRLFSELIPEAALGQRHVVSVATVPYAHPYTYDILPDSDSGGYLAAGALIGSTLR